MDDFGMLARDFGYRPQGKSAPMKSASSGTSDQARDDLLFSDVFGGPPKYSSSSSNSNSNAKAPDFDYDSIFKSSSGGGGGNEQKREREREREKESSLPVYDKPVYDEDIFDGLPGLKSKSMNDKVRLESDVFASIGTSPPKRKEKERDQFDDLLGNLGRTGKVERGGSGNLGGGGGGSKSSRGFDDLLPGFGSSSPPLGSRFTSEPTQGSKSSSNTKETTSNVMEDPFVVLESTSNSGAASSGLFTDPLEEMGRHSKSGSSTAGHSSVSGGVFEDLDPLSSFGKSVPAFSSELNNRGKDQSPSREGSMGRTHNSSSREPMESSSFRYSESHVQKKVPVDNFQGPQETLFDMPTDSRESRKSFEHSTSPPAYANLNRTETSSEVNMPPREHVQPTSDDIWLTVSEIPLFTQPTRAPPPSRPPPPIPRHIPKSETGSFASNARKSASDYHSSTNSSHYSQSPRPGRPATKSHVSNSMDGFDNFATGKTRNSVNENFDVHNVEEISSNSSAEASAAAMKEAMDRAEAKFRHAKEVREREHAKAARSREFVQMERDEQLMEESQEGELRENQERLDRERRQRERDEEERERRRIERERAKELERERARQAVERATREARERAAAEARLKAAEKAAVQRAQAEARERAAVEARERAERAATEARERAAAEARAKEAREKESVSRAEADSRRRAERAVVDRVNAEARERAAAEARERAAAAARMNQQKNDNDLESFFSSTSRPSSAPRPRANSTDNASDVPSQNRGAPEGAKRTSSAAPANMKKASSTTNIVDDLNSIFGAAQSAAGQFQDVEGETEERRRARLERHQRTQERAAKALAEKNQRDLQSQREQEERHRISESLDFEIKRWSAGKEGNLRALLSTLQYVLWPECGWQPVSLTDLIMGASVKKVYRKATLCIHPDKVQQKGATLQQKYIAEKVFDLLKEAWNKFNSEELF